MKNNLKLNKTIIFISIIFFIISLTQKSFSTVGGPISRGIMDLLVGWMGVIMLDPPAMVWLANPILILSWAVNKRHKKASLGFSIVAFITMLLFLFFDEVIVNESGYPSKITSIKLGYWLWVSSAFIMVMGNAFLYYKKEKEE